MTARANTPFRSADMPTVCNSLPRISSPVPASAGIGLRGPHCEQLLAELPDVGWLEVHSENFFCDGGRQLDLLERAAGQYPLSLHGVGLSLGSVDPLDNWHLDRLRRLVDRFQPMLVSEHLCWGSIDGSWFNDLLPLPYTEEALQHMIGRVNQVQDYLGRRILIENVSSYLEFHDSRITEWDFLAALAQRSGCGLLLDINNVYVSSRNHGFDPYRYLSALPVEPVLEMHLAGHSINSCDGYELLIDTHGAEVSEPVWELYRFACRRFRNCPTLLEWDTNLPPLETLVGQARRADFEREDSRVRIA